MGASRREFWCDAVLLSCVVIQEHIACRAWKLFNFIALLLFVLFASWRDEIWLLLIIIIDTVQNKIGKRKRKGFLSTASPPFQQESISGSKPRSVVTRCDMSCARIVRRFGPRLEGFAPHTSEEKVCLIAAHSVLGSSCWGPPST